MPSPAVPVNLHPIDTSPQDWQQTAPPATPQVVQRDVSRDSPRRPSYSPVTPTFQEGFSDGSAQAADLIDEPEPVPIKLEDNPDAIALKAALSILQMQKQQSQRDIKQLNEMKDAARQDPQAFVDALKAGTLTKAPPRATLGSQHDPEMADERLGHSSESRFGKFPDPLNIVRTPPINWAKYHIVGESLNKLHEEQRQRPEPGFPQSERDPRPPEHVMAAPYRPFVDVLDPVSSAAQLMGKRAEFKP